MAEGHESLGKARLDLEANVVEFDKNISGAHRTAEGLGDSLDHLAVIADVAEHALNRVKLDAGSATRSRVSAEQIVAGVRGIGRESLEAAHELDRVKVSEEQATLSEVAGGRIERMLEHISRKAGEARRALESVRLAGVLEGRTGAGIGPFGSGFGRIGVLGAAVGLGAVTAPAAGPAAVGLLGAIPALAFAGVGALGALVLAFKGVGKAIGGDKKAFDELDPAAQRFVLTVRSLDGWFDKLRATAAKGLFPGLTGGLKAALSPGTVSVLTASVAVLAHALGMASLEWGHFFGSAEFQQIFGPLMLSAARNIQVLSDTFLHLFVALGVLGRAAIPFTNWLTTAIDHGARFASTWLHAKEATGQLGHAMSEAQTSLRLVGGLFVSMLRVVGALGVALYPVAKIAVKALTDGLNALAKIVQHNQGLIRTILIGALHALVGAVKVAAAGVHLLINGLDKISGGRGKWIVAIAAIGTALLLALGPASAAVVGAIIAIGLIRNHWRTIGRFFKNLGHEIVNAFKYVWYQLERGALKAALAVVEPFSHLPSFLGGWARKAKDSMQAQLDRLQPPNMAWGGYAQQAGAYDGLAWRKGFATGIAGAVADAVQSIGQAVHDAAARKHHRKPSTVTLPAPPTRPSSGDVFGPPPPFTKNTGSGGGSASTIPQDAVDLEALARRQDQAAAALNYAGKAARSHLEKEIVDLQKADRILEEKLKHAHGKKRTELYNALTANMKKIAEARKRITDAISKGRQADLNFALDQAKAAAGKAAEGSKAWDRAITAEEKALNADIRYWDKRAHNDKLSKDARDAALKKEISYERQLKELLTQRNQAVAANEAQFIQTWNDIEGTFGSNAVPVPGAPTSGRTDTHLHDLKNEARESNRHLKAIRAASRFPDSRAGFDAAMAVSG